MVKKIFSYIGVLALVCFSFYYTEIATNLIRKNDPIMKEIDNKKEKYSTKCINALVDKNSIIPGINGIKVDLKKSFESMKKYGSFNESLLVFEEETPVLSINNIYDKYIVKGNSNKKMVSLIFIIKDYSYISEILNVLNSKGIHSTFFVDSKIFEESKDILKLLNNSKNKIELYSSDYMNIYKYNRILKTITNQDLSFCYINSKESEIPKSCIESKMHTVLPTLNTSFFPFNDIKNDIEPGYIIKLENNMETLRELKYIINYIRQKGLEIVTLDELIKE